MELYTVNTYMMCGSEVIAVFSNELFAKEFLGNNSIPTATIEKYPVVGSQIKNNTIFASHRYDKSLDIHKFDALFTDFDEAREFSGKDSLVKNLEIDSRRIEK
jgi:hypothetical protein